MVKRGPRTLVWLAVFGASRAVAQVAEQERAPDAAAPQGAPAEAEGSADEREAKRTFEVGLQFLHEEQWDRAEEAFRRSLATVPRDSTKYDLAYVLFKRGHLRQSLSILKELVAHDASGGDPRYREYATTLMPHVVGRLATLHLRTSIPGAALVVDGEIVQGVGTERDVQLDPGHHVADVEAPGFASKHFAFSVAPGATVDRVAVFERTESLPVTDGRQRSTEQAGNAPSSIHSFGPWVTIGLGGALLAGGAIVGLLARRADDDFVAACPTLRDCSPDLRDAQGRAETLGHVSDALLISGAVVASGGIAWKLLAPSPAPGHSAANRGLVVSFSGVY